MTFNPKGDGESSLFNDIVQIRFKVDSDNVQDSSAPTATHTITPSAPDGANGWYISNTMINIKITDDDCYLNTECNLMINTQGTGGQYNKKDWNWTNVTDALLAGGEGMLDLYYYTIDPAGDFTGNPVNIKLQVDKTPPWLTQLTGPTEWVAGQIVTFNWISADQGGSGIDHFQYKLDDGAPVETTESTSTISTPSDGTHAFSVRAIDKAGLIGDWSVYSFKVDRAPPVVENLAGPAGWIKNGTDEITFTWTGNDDFGADVNSTIDLFEYKVNDSAPAACTSPLTIPVPKDGNYRLYVRATDKAGNVGTFITLDFKVDQSRPTITGLAGPTGWVNVSQPEATFTWSGNDQFEADVLSGIASYEYHIDDGTDTACSSPLVLDLPLNGTHSFHVRALDVAGNAGEYVTLEFKLDKSPPTVTGLAGPAWWERNATTNLTWSGTDETEADVVSGIVKYEYRVDDGVIKEGASKLNIPTGADGTHTLAVRAIDAAGNIGDFATFELKVDRTTPVVSDLAGPTWWERNATTNFTWSGTDGTDPKAVSGIGRYEYKVDDGTEKEGMSKLNIPTGTDGTHTMEVRAIDVAGNIGEWASVEFKVDRTPPTVTEAELESGGLATGSPSFVLEVTLSNGADGSPLGRLGIKVGTGAWTWVAIEEGGATPTVSVPVTVDGAGGHDIVLKADDEAGNVGTELKVTVTYTPGAKDLLPPVVSSLVPTDGTAVVDRTPEISASYSDATTGGSGIDIASVKLALDGADVTSSATVSATGISYTPGSDLAFGEHTVSLTVRDLAPDKNKVTKAWSFEVVELVADIVSIRLQPDPLSVMVGQEVVLSVVGTDSKGVEHPDLPATLGTTGGVGTIAGMTFKATAVGMGTVTAQYGSLTDDLSVTVVAAGTLPGMAIGSVVQDGKKVVVTLVLDGALPSGTKCMVSVDGGDWTEVPLDESGKLDIDVSGLSKGPHTLGVKLALDTVQTNPSLKEFTLAEEGGTEDEGASGSTMLLLVALLIIIVVVALLLVMSRRRPRAAEAPPTASLSPVAEAEVGTGGGGAGAAIGGVEIAGGVAASSAGASKGGFTTLTVNTFCAACGSTIGKGTNAYVCSCGTAIHEPCAGRLRICPNCKKGIDI